MSGKNAALHLELTPSQNSSEEFYDGDEPNSLDERDVVVVAGSEGECGTVGSTLNSAWRTLAGVAGNVLERCDFANFGFLSDVIGRGFFHQASKPKLRLLRVSWCLEVLS